jgi:enamine deaminase RidA (YjgF/YER057c/UK114 family)
VLKELAMTVEQKLAEFGLTLPVPPQPLGSYTPVSEAGNLLFISGQVPLSEGKMAYTGRVGDTLSVEEGKRAAQLAALNALAQIGRHLGGFDRLHHVVRVEGHVSCADGFYDQAAVVDGASDLFAAVLGDKAGHARSAFSHRQLPANAAVVIVVIAQIDPA